MLHTLLVLALILGSVWPLLDSETVLLILEPLSLVPTSIEMCVDSIAICFIFSPLALIDISLGMHESAIAISHSVPPEAVIPGSVRPYLHSTAIFLVLVDEPLALIDCPILKYANRLYFPLFSIRNVLNRPVKRLQLLDYVLHKIVAIVCTYHDYLIIILRLENLQLLILEELKVAFASCVVCLISLRKPMLECVEITYEDLFARVPGRPPGTSHSVVVSLSAVLQQAPIFD